MNSVDTEESLRVYQTKHAVEYKSQRRHRILQTQMPRYTSLHDISHSYIWKKTGKDATLNIDWKRRAEVSNQTAIDQFNNTEARANMVNYICTLTGER